MDDRSLRSLEVELGAMPRFPPQAGADIAAYDLEECVAGYSEQRADEPEPGANRSPAYRWGWQNRKRDRQAADDGFDGLRSAYLQERRNTAGGAGHAGATR